MFASKNYNFSDKRKEEIEPGTIIGFVLSALICSFRRIKGIALFVALWEMRRNNANRIVINNRRYDNITNSHIFVDVYHLMKQ